MIYHLYPSSQNKNTEISIVKTSVKLFEALSENCFSFIWQCVTVSLCLYSLRSAIIAVGLRQSSV